MTAPLTRAELADLFPGPVIVTPLTAADVVLDTERTYILHDDGTREAVIIQPLYSDKDRAKLKEIIERNK